MVGGDRTCMLVVVRYRQAIGDSYEKNKRQAFDLEPCSKRTLTHPGYSLELSGSPYNSPPRSPHYQIIL